MIKDIKLAVLIDGDNIPSKYIKEMMEEITKYGTPTVKRIYGDWTKPHLSKWKNILLENAITPIQQYGYTTGKNATDSAMIIDAMDILYSEKVDGWFEMHKKFGTMKMEQLLAPAIKYANEGFPVTELIGYYLNLTSRRFKDYPNFTETYMPNGALNKGVVFKNPFLANTYQKIAKGGRDAFYKGEIAKTIADFLQAEGGVLSEKDLANHKSEWVEPVSTNYRGYDVWELPPNGQGIAAFKF